VGNPTPKVVFFRNSRYKAAVRTGTKSVNAYIQNFSTKSLDDCVDFKGCLMRKPKYLYIVYYFLNLYELQVSHVLRKMYDYLQEEGVCEI
jgi:hypothetical protein